MFNIGLDCIITPFPNLKQNQKNQNQVDHEQNCVSFKVRRVVVNQDFLKNRN